jgi:hypothetical protein
MSKPDFSFTDPAFNRNQTAEMLLIVDISWDRIASAVYDPSRKTWVAFESWSTGKLQLPGQLLEKFNQVRENSSFLNKEFQQTKVIWGGLRYTLVPSALYDETHAEDYIQFVQSLQPGELVCADRLKKIEAANIFVIPAIIKESLKQIFPLHHLNHHISLLAESLLVWCQNHESSVSPFVNVSAQSFDLIIFKDRKLIFCNTYEYRTAEDFLYYVLFAFEQLQIIPGETNVKLLGEIMRPSVIYDFMTKYIKDVTFIPRSSVWNYSFVFDDLPGHMYYNLLNILTCE